MSIAPAAGTAVRTSSPAPVTVLGLGMMGRALADTYLAAGYPTTVWNRSSGKDDALVAAGAARAATVTDAVSASSLVVVCVTTHEAVLEALAPAGDALAGRTLVNLTSGTPEQAQQLAAWAAERGADYLDGAIMAIPPEMGHADTLVLFSGSADVFETHRDALRVLGGRATYLGESIELAAIYDLAMLSSMYTLLGGFLHGVALVKSAQVKAEAFVPFVSGSLSTVIGWLADMAREIDERQYETDVSSLDINKDGVALIRTASETRGVSGDMLAPLQAMIERRVAAGHGRHGLASLIEEFRRPATSA